MNKPSVPELADELFRSVERDQGLAHVSDGQEALPSHDDFFNVVRAQLRHAEAAAQKLRAFLVKYREI